MGRTFDSMEEPMPAPSGNRASVELRVAALGLVLPAPPTPLGAYVEASETGNWLFLSGILPIVDGNVAMPGRLGENLSVEQGQEAARVASLKVLAAAKQ